MGQTPNALLRDATLAESGSLESAAEVFVRPYPFPFRAAFSLSNDCDSSTLEAFEDWHGFVNGRAATRYGDGLGLEIGDSFWVWLGGTGGLALGSGFADEPFKETAQHRRLVELGRAGWLDSLHSLGNWRQDYKSFRHDLGTRGDAERALAMLAERGLKPFVYTNHSWSPSNVSGPWGFYQKIDDPSHPMYAMDLLRDFGFRYFWPDYAVETAKFGDHWNFENDEALRKAIAGYRQWKLIYKRTSPTENSLIEFDCGEDTLRKFYLAMYNRTIVRTQAMDGAPLAAFKRYRGNWQADESSFHLQASAENLDALESAGGAVVVYQHFGVTRRGPEQTKQRSAPPVLSDASADAWRGIAHRESRGDLFVTTTGRLLDYLCLAELLGFTLTKTPERWTIALPDVERSDLWSRRPERELLNGLSFVVPADAPEVVVLNAAGRALACRRAGDPVRPGRHAVYLPWQKLEWIISS